MNSILELLGHGRTCSALRSVIALAVASLGMGTTFAAQTDISSTPFSSTTSAQAKPNIMLLMDTSGSMGWGHMPDEVETATKPGSVGYKSAQCNVLYYNRTLTYLVPKKPDGSLFPTPSFTAARYAGYGDYYVTPDTTTVNLSSAFVPYEANTLRVPPTVPATPQAAYYYYYTGSLPTLAYGAQPCTDTDNIANGTSKNTTDGTGTWTRVQVGPTSGPGNADERTNFAIWYSYYRTRMSLTKSAASLAFTPLTDSFRVGFITVKPKDTPSSASINPSKYLAINDFNTTQRTAWFSKLFSQAPDGSSPAREGLARVGRHYAGMTDGINSGMSGDPVQYSCQQNFTIMTTDGYWNAQAETLGGGPVDIDGVPLTKSQDSDETGPAGLTPKPIWDGAITSVRTTKDASNFYYDDPCTGSALFMTTSQKLASTKQVTRSTEQTSKTTAQYRSGTQQWLQTTRQFTLSTAQTRQTIDQYTTITERYSSETLQYTQATEQTRQTTLQYSTATSQRLRTTYQRSQSTLQYKLGTQQQRRRDYQNISYDALTELGTPVATCTAGGNISCQTREVSAWVPVATCTAGTGPAPNYIVTQCQTNTVSAVAPVASCSPGTTTGPGPGYLISTCTSTATGPTLVSTCSPGISGGGSPPYITTTCTNIPITTDVLVASCTNGNSGSPNYITTSCTTTPVQAAAPSDVCTVGSVTGPGPDYITTTCTRSINNSIFLVNAPACAPDQAASSSNSWTSITCVKTAPPAAPVNTTCTPGRTFDNTTNYKYTTCAVNTISANAAIPGTCTLGSVVGVAPTYYRTNCTYTLVTPQTTVASCAPGTTVGPAPNYNQTTCAHTVTTTPVATCTPSAPGVIPVRTCNPNNTTAIVSSCTPGTTNSGSPSFITSTCTVATLTNNVPVATCNNGVGPAPAYINTSCTNVQPPAVGVATCSQGTTPGVAPNYINTICTFDNPTVYVPDAASCVADTPDAGNNFVDTKCNTVIVPAAFAPACTPGSSGSPNYVNTTCIDVPGASPAPVAICTPGVGPGPDYIQTICTDGPGTGPTPVLACTGGNSGAPYYTTTSCATGPAPGLRRLFNSTITSSIQNMSGVIPVGAAQPGPTTTLSGQATDGVCYVTGLTTPPPLPVPNPYQPSAAEPPLASSVSATCASWPCAVTTPNVIGGTINSLADVAQYYYVTDLRPGPLWPNTGPGSVPAIGGGPEDDRATWQHMTTFTIALGVSGTLNYRSNYRSSAAVVGDLPDDFARIRTGALGWPIWPDPANYTYTDPEQWNNARSIDDYWHTAVNGRGQYFSAGNPTSVIAGLSGALAGITARVASGSSAGASSLQPTAGDNFAFVASYVTSKWTGDVRAELIDLVTGVIGTTTVDGTGATVPGPPVWSAQTRLDALTGMQCDNRKIYLLRAGATDNKVNFSWNTQACDATMSPVGGTTTGLNASEQAYFQGANITVLSQYPSMTDGSAATVDQRTSASGANLVNFLRGQRGNEGFESGTANKLYRDREHVLGDMVNAQPVYVKGPFADYGDAGYQAFKTANAARTPMVYSAANDGMLHAFYAGTSATDPDGGLEAWAIIPSTVLPNLYKLADANYKNTHQYSVDGTPTVGDIYDTNSSSWKTMLVGGLNAGGKGYYALDVTNPATPRGLWEFKWSNTCYDGTPATAGSDCNLGFTFGRPVITKLSGGQWVVMFTSGYNNISSPPAAGDGVGYLYVLNAATGQIIHKLSTGVGDSTTPSGLGQINNFVDNTLINNTSVRVYGGDMLGNIWRFDVNDNLAPSGREASLVGTATDPGGSPEPITVRPELAEVNGKPMVFVSTGRLLGASDVSDLQVQSIYGIIDPLAGNPAYTNLRSVLKPLAMTQVGAGPTAYRTVACTGTTAECGTTNGWVVNLPDSGERVNINMELVLGTLIVGSNVPQSTACSSGGYGWINYLDFATGLVVTGSPNQSVSVIQDGGLIAGIKTIQLPNGQFKTEIRKGDGTNAVGTPPIGPAIPRGNRISWREIAQ